MSKAAATTETEDTGGPSVDEIGDKILQAIWEHRLPPGHQARGGKAGGACSASAAPRSGWRSASCRTTASSRWSPTAAPSSRAPRWSRRARSSTRAATLEPALLRDLCGHVRREQLARLRKNIAQEGEARARNDRRATIRLSGQFHVLIAEVSHNPYLGKCMRELCSLDLPRHRAVRRARHAGLPAPRAPPRSSTRSRRAMPKACALMVEHLTHVENTLRLEMPGGEEIDFEAVFALAARAGSGAAQQPADRGIPRLSAAQSKAKVPAWISLPPLNAIRAFEAAARHMSITLAADELHVTPGAVSRQIKMPRRRARGCSCFKRGHRQISLTRARR